MVQRIQRLTERLNELSEATELLALEYEPETEDEKLSLSLKEEQSREILVNADLLLRITLKSEGFYTIETIDLKCEDADCIETFDIFLNNEESD